MPRITARLEMSTDSEAVKRVRQMGGEESSVIEEAEPSVR